MFFVITVPVSTRRRHHKPVAGGLRAKGVATIIDQAVVRGLAHQHAVTVPKGRLSVGVVPRHRVRKFECGTRSRASGWGHLTARNNVFAYEAKGQGE